MKNFAQRVSTLTPEQRALFESRLKKKAALLPHRSISRAGVIPKRERQNHCVLSFDQERIWIIDRMEPGNAAYNIYTVSRLLGPLNLEALERAINEIIRRHEILRTTFSTVAGEPVMVISPELVIKLQVTEISGGAKDQRIKEAIAITNDATAQPFNLETGPLLRVGIIRLGLSDHVVHITMHHSITDRWSAVVLEQEMVAIYSAFIDDKPSPLDPVDLQFADFAEWQRGYLQGDVLAGKLAYWKNELSGAPLVLELPTDRPRPPFQKFRGAREVITLPGPSLRGLKSFTQAEGATMFMTLLAAYNLLLYRYTGQEDILVGLAMANRGLAGTENMLGYLLNMVIIRAGFSARTSFRELLAVVRQSAIGAFANLDLPLGSLIEELKPVADPSRNPIFQVAYIYLDFPPEEGMEFLKINPIPLEADNGSSRFDMTLALTELPDRLDAMIEYNTDLFMPETVRRMLQHLSVLLEGVVEDPDRALSELGMLTAPEIHQIQSMWSGTSADFPRDQAVHQLAELTAARCEDSTAVVYGESRLTYGELNERANKFAHYLASLGVGASGRVAVCLERSPELIVSLLGILKAGAMYVPVDPGYPLERMTHILEDSECSIVVSQESLVGSLPSCLAVTISVDADWQTIAFYSERARLTSPLADSPAYVIYTSGSTGGPRGVAVAHRAIARLVLNTNYIQLGPESVVAQCASASFDATTFEIWGALLNGSQLVIIDKDVALMPREFSSELLKHGVSVLFLTTALFNQVARHNPQAFRSMKYVLFGGEAVTPGWVRAVVEAGAPRHLLHVYGPTENTTYSSFFTVDSVSGEEAIPIGLPITNTSIHVVDRNLNAVPASVTGELFISGEGLAQCYLNRADLTAESFIPNWAATLPGERTYRSGDLGKRRPDGNIVFVGRNDFQVKVRGFRIELEEAEAAIKRHPGVIDAAVLVSEGSEHERRLVAYVVPRADYQINIGELRRFVSGSLPEYMAPSAMVEMGELPLTENGKVDRSKLPDPGQSRPDLGLEYVAPTTLAEVSLCEIWASVLGLDRVGVRDNFFDLGGDSIRSIQVMSRSERAGHAFSIQELFQNPTVDALAAIIDSRNGRCESKPVVDPFSMVEEEDKAAIPESAEDAYPLTMLQAGMIFHSELSPTTAVYHDIFSFHLRTFLDLESMQQSVAHLIARHPILRTSFNSTETAKALQLIWKEAELSVQFEDISSHDSDKQRAFVRDFVDSERSNGFSWDRAPLLRLWIHKRTDESFQFTLSFHHAILDGWSLSCFFAELFGLYLAKVKGRPEPVFEMPDSSFKDFVALEIEAVRSDELRRFWEDQLDSALLTTIPLLNRPQAPDPSGQSGTREIDIGESLTHDLLALSRRLGVPLKSLLMAIHAKVLALVSGRNDIVTGLVSNGRPEGQDADRILGLFLNTIPVRIRLEPALTWEGLAIAAFNAEKAMLPYRRYPLAEMQRVTGRNPLLETAFNFTHFHIARGILAAQDVEILEQEIVSETNFPFLLDFNLDPVDSLLQGAIKYHLSMFEASDIDLIGNYYARALNAMVERPWANHGWVPLLSPGEIDALIQHPNPANVDYGSEFVHEMVEAQAKRTPDSVALISADLHLSYEEVNVEANRLACRLARLGGAPDRRIGIMLDRSPDMCTGLLATLKTGAAYVPIDTAFPGARLELMLGAVEILLTQSKYLERAAGTGIQCPVVCVDQLGEMSSFQRMTPSPELDPDNLVYVIFTSGSTGTPKGVAITHKVAANMVRWNTAVLPNSTRVLQFASPSFDVAFQEIFTTWSAGGTLVLITESTHFDQAALAKHISEQRVERLFLPSVVLQQLAEHLLTDESDLAVKEVITAGEQLKVSSEVRALLKGFKDRALHNHYGPSETHAVTAYCLPHNDAWPDLPPIGTPISNARIYLLSENMEPVPNGVPGEIFIGGEVVGRGYIGRPELTAERFTCDLYWGNGSRLYRTGDLGRRRLDGEIDFIGRLDSQVKVRGFRVELGEIEVVLSAHHSVRQAIVTAFDGARGKTLVAYVVPVSLEAPSPNELDEFLKGRVPAYMLPAGYVFLERLPTTATGKVDKRALPPPEAVRSARSMYSAPDTPTEAVVAGIWSAVLATPDVGTHDNFFELGGHSLLANQIVSRIRSALQDDLQLKALFDHPTVAELSAHIDERGSGSQPNSASGIKSAAPDSSWPLSIAQRRLWFLEQLDPHNGAYHIGMSLRMVGDLNLGAMEQAQTEIVRRHEVLRSLIVADNGSPYQIVQAAGPFVGVLDLTGVHGSERDTTIREMVSRLHSKHFDLAEAPPIKSWIVKVGDREHILAVTMHHLVSDGWSVNIFNDELAVLYESFVFGGASPLSEMSLQYRDFAAWQNNWFRNGRFDSDLSYWKRQLGEDIPVVDIPADHARLAARNLAGATVVYNLDAESRARLKQIADAEGATLFMAYLGSFLCLLYRYTGQSDLIAGIPISGRNQPEIENLIGFFVNTLVLRSSVSGSMTIRQVIHQARDVFLEAHAHQDLPFELLVEELKPERNPSRSPFFDLMLDLQAESGRATSIGNLELAPFQHVGQTSKFDMTISIADSVTDPRMTIEYSTALFERSSVDRLAAHFNRLVESAVRTPDAPINQLALMGQTEIKQILVDFNGTSRPFPAQSSMHVLFDSEAARLADAIAVVFEDHNITYHCLSRRANTLFRLLRERGISAESRVGICLPRSIDMVVSLIAVVKAGSAYVPMDASYPAARLEFMATDAAIELLITSSEMLGNVSTGSDNILCIDTGCFEEETGISLPEGPAVFPDSLAYIIYTSGTTGSPKGVGITHRGVVRLVKASNYAQLDEKQVILQHSTVSFDSATFEIWGCLLNGARLILMPDDMFSVQDLERAIERHQVTTAWLTGGLFRLMADQLTGGLNSLRQLLAGGEALPADQVNRFIDLMGPERLINGYGPTEVTTFTCCHRFAERVDPSRAVPLGRPISNTAVYVLDRSLNPVPVAVKGQIYASGPGLARGYLNNTDLTAERFLPDPFSQRPGERMYATGDTGCHRGEEYIEFLGRLDSQVKLRGYRIELGEIESVIATYPGVSSTVVVIWTDKAGERRLAAYAAGKPGTRLTSNELREHAKATLPEFMIPSSFVVVDAIPLTRSGKVDRSALANPAADIPSGEARFEPPRNAIEEGLALIWMRVLGRDRIGIHDDFFRLGGHSLLATQVVSRIREAFEVDVPLRSLFENKNISRLGGVVEALLLDRLEALSEEEAADLLG